MTCTPKEQAFIDAFEQGTLALDAFQHRDHARLAWLYLRRYPVPEVLIRYGDGLKRLTQRLGKEGVYTA